MNLFIVIFYISLLGAGVVLLSVRHPNHASTNQATQQWFLVNLQLIEAVLKKFYSNTIRPTAVKATLSTLKVTQNHLQSVRRRLRHLIIRLSDLDERHHRSSGQQHPASSH